MIYTCTLNPSLDYYMTFDNPIENGKVNRSKSEYYEAGGKGVNVSIALNNLHIPNRAFGFIGGFTKDFYISLLQKYEFLEPMFTVIDGNTRINVKVSSDENFELNAEGPHIDEKAMTLLKNKVARLSDKDILVFSGAVNDYIVDDACAMLKDALEEKVKLVLDTDVEIVKKMLSSNPFLVKLDVKDLDNICNTTSSSQDEVISKMKECVSMGAQNVMVRMDKATLLVSGDDVYITKDVEGEVVNVVGSGSSTIAGFIMNYNRSHDVLESFKFAACCSAATAMNQGMGTLDMINTLYDKVIVEKL